MGEWASEWASEWIGGPAEGKDLVIDQVRLCNHTSFACGCCNARDNPSADATMDQRHGWELSPASSLANVQNFWPTETCAAPYTHPNRILSDTRILC